MFFTVFIVFSCDSQSTNPLNNPLVPSSSENLSPSKLNYFPPQSPSPFSTPEPTKPETDESELNSKNNLAPKGSKKPIPKKSAQRTHFTTGRHLVPKLDINKGQSPDSSKPPPDLGKKTLADASDSPSP